MNADSIFSFTVRNNQPNISQPAISAPKRKRTVSFNSVRKGLKTQFKRLEEVRVDVKYRIELLKDMKLQIEDEIKKLERTQEDEPVEITPPREMISVFDCESGESTEEEKPVLDYGFTRRYQ